MSQNSDRPFAATRYELVLLAACLGLGAFILPFAVYFVGVLIFGEFGSGGLMDFYASVQFNIWTLNPVVWFLVLSPYLVVQTIRLTYRCYTALRN